MRVRKMLFFFILIFSKCFETCASGSIESAFDVLSDEVVMMPMKELATRDFIALSLTNKRFQRLSQDTEFRFSKDDLEAVLEFFRRPYVEPETIVKKIARTRHSTRILYYAFLRVYQDHPEILEGNFFVRTELAKEELIQRIEIFKPYYSAIYLASLLGDKQAIDDQLEVESSLKRITMPLQGMTFTYSLQSQNEETFELSDLIEEIAPLECRKALLDHNYKLVLFWHNHYQINQPLKRKVTCTQFEKHRTKREEKLSKKGLIQFSENQTILLEEEIQRCQTHCLKKENCRFRIPGSPNKIGQLIHYKKNLLDIYGRISEYYDFGIKYKKVNQEFKIKAAHYFEKYINLDKQIYSTILQSRSNNYQFLASMIIDRKQKLNFWLKAINAEEVRLLFSKSSTNSNIFRSLADAYHSAACVADLGQIEMMHKAINYNLKALKNSDNESLNLQRLADSYYFVADKIIFELSKEEREKYRQNALGYYILARDECLRDKILADSFLISTDKWFESVNRLDKVEQMIEVLINEKSENSA